MNRLDIYPSEEIESIMVEISEITSTAESYYIPPKMIRKIYRLFIKWKLIARKKENWWWALSMYAFERDVTHFLVERCYWMRYGDSQTVSDLLKSLFAVDGHLGKIFDFQQLTVGSRMRAFEPNAIIGNKTSWSEELLQEEKIKPIDYFMDHAYKSKVLFNGRRFAEQYLVQCVYQLPRNVTEILRLPPCSTTFKAPDVLLKLLQRGVFVSKDAISDLNVSKLLTGIIGAILSVSCSMQPKTFFEGQWAEYSYKIIECGNILLRAIDRIDVSKLFGVQKRKLRKNCLTTLIKNLSAPHLLPKLSVRCSGPQELQHLCRCQTRRSLYANWQLPQGTSMLRIPQYIKEYINLERD